MVSLIDPRRGVNHGTFLHIAHEEGLILNSSMHAGIRAPVSNEKYDLKHDKACGFHILRARDLDKYGSAGFVERLKHRVQGTKVYISVDIDVLDPAYAPATGTAEPGGWTTRELLTILDALSGIELVGADVVEVAPVSSQNMRSGMKTYLTKDWPYRYMITAERRQHWQLLKLSGL